MELSFLSSSTSPHKANIASVGWSSSGEAYSCSHDQTIWRWNRNGEPISKVCVCHDNITDMHWHPPLSQRHRGVSGGDVFACSYSNGTLSIINKAGREEKRMDAHKGEVLCLRWNPEGTALATGGEDGLLKLWSRNGMLRSNVTQCEQAVCSLSWGPENNQLVFCSGKTIVIKYVQSAIKDTVWEAHEARVMRVDWNRTNQLVISVGEEGCYKVWDSYGRLSYRSTPFQCKLSCIAWSQSGEVLVVGGSNLIMLCDKSGHVLSNANVDAGGIRSLAWSMDGSHLAMGCSNGTMQFAHVIGRRIEWLRWIATIEDSHHIHIQDLISGETRKLDFKDFIINASLCFNQLVVITFSQCFVYRIQDWRCHIIDVKDVSAILKQSDNCFLITDYFNEFHIYTYEGKKLSSPSFSGLRTDLLNDHSIDLAKDILVVVDTNDSKALRFFDINTGKETGDALHHTNSVIAVALNQQGSNAHRVLSFIDSNWDLFITEINNPCITKLACMAKKTVWSSDTDILLGMVDGNLLVWYYPQAILVDVDLLRYLRVKKQSFQGKNATIHNFQATRCTVKYEDGTFITLSISPTAFLFFQYISTGKWDQAKKLCWVFKEKSLWASIAAAAMTEKRFSIAEEAYTALDKVDKVKFISRLRGRTSEVVREAEYALFKRQPNCAESLLVNSGLIYRAIKLNLRLFKWDRALEIAIQYNRHVDTVLWKRSEYLLDTNQKETKESFLSVMDQVEIDVPRIKEAISKEKENEKNLRETPTC